MNQNDARASQPHGFKAMDSKKRQKTICKDLDKLSMKEANEEIRALCEAIDYGNHLPHNRRTLVTGRDPPPTLSPR
jgi:hypothetical protein